MTTNFREVLNRVSQFNARITLREDDEVVSSDNTVADVLNTCFSNIRRNLNLPEYPISNPIIKAV